MTIPGVPDSELCVDWNNSGIYGDSVGEYVTGRIRVDPGIRTVRGRDQARLLSPPRAGSFEVVLDNQSGDYYKERASGPLYGNLLPGRSVRFRQSYLGITYDIWKGNLDRLLPRPSISRRDARLSCLGSLAQLVGKRVSTQLYEFIRTDQALGYILDAVGWPAGARVLDVGKTTLPYWWLDDADAFDAAVELYATEGPGAYLGEDGQGRIVFESRHYRLLTARCTTSQAIFRDENNGADPYFSEPFGYDDGEDSVVNVCTVSVNVRAVQALAVVWQNGSDLTLGAGEVRKIGAKTSDPFKAAVAPVAGIDYTVTAGSVVSVTISRTSGQSTEITVTAGPAGATVTGLQLRAQAVTVSTRIKRTNTVDTSASQLDHGIRTYPLSIWPEIGVEVAQDLANAIVGIYQDPRPAVELTILPGHEGNRVQQLAREVSDRITVIEKQSGMNGPVFIERIGHTIRDQGIDQVTVFGCEKASDVSYGIWDTSVWDGCVWGF